MNKCKKCGAKIIPAWKYCNECSRHLPKEQSEFLTHRQELLIEAQQSNIEYSLWQANNIISAYGSFFAYFEEQLKPLTAKWSKMHKTVDNSKVDNEM